MQGVQSSSFSLVTIYYSLFIIDKAVVEVVVIDDNDFFAFRCISYCILRIPNLFPSAAKSIRQETKLKECRKKNLLQALL